MSTDVRQRRPDVWVHLAMVISLIGMLLSIAWQSVPLAVVMSAFYLNTGALMRHYDRH